LVHEIQKLRRDGTAISFETPKHAWGSKSGVRIGGGKSKIVASGQRGCSAKRDDFKIGKK